MLPPYYLNNFFGRQSPTHFVIQVMQLCLHFKMFFINTNTCQITRKLKVKVGKEQTLPINLSLSVKPAGNLILDKAFKTCIL